MDPKLFKQQIEQYAELQQITAARTAGMREPEEAVVIERQGQVTTIDPDNNQTLQWRIKCLKNTARVCEDCYKVVDSRVVEIKRYPNPTDHWRKHCKACNLGMNPYSNKFELENKDAQYYNACWLNGNPEPHSLDQVKQSISRPVFKKPAK